MSISIKDFKEGNFLVRGDNENHPLSVLLRNNKKAFTVKELIKETKLSNWAIRNKIADLKKRKLIVHKSPYIIYADHLK